MMEDAALSPTREQLRRDEYVPPEINQQIHRRAWRKVSVFENLHTRGEIEMFQKRAAEKLEMHFHGAQGADVRFTDEASGYNEDCEYPRTWHAQKLSQAQSQLRPKEWLALIDIIMGASVEDVGRKWRAVGTAKIARAQGLVLVSEGLDVLGEFWGLKSGGRAKRPAL